MLVLWKKICDQPVKAKVAQLCLTLCDCMRKDSPWNSPGQNTGVGSRPLLQGIFLTQEVNQSLLYCRWILYQLRYQRILDSILKSRDITSLTKVYIVTAIVFPVVMYKCENWTIKKAQHWRIDAFELWCWRRLESSLDCKEFKPVNPKGNQPWIFTGKADAKPEAQILWPPDVKSWLIGKDPEAGKDWRQEKGATEDEMVGWHHQLNRHQFEQTLGDSEEQGSLAYCSSWGCRVKHDLLTEQ